MRRYLIAPAVIVVALGATVWLPFVNSGSLWLGLPAIMVWTVLWVLAITPALAALEFSGRYRESDARDLQERRAAESAAARSGVQR